MTDYRLLKKRIVSQIKKFRKKKKITQVELARMIKKSDKYINGLESGIESISLKSLVDIANALDEPIECFITNTEPEDFSSRINALEEKDKDTLIYLLTRLEE